MIEKTMVCDKCRAKKPYNEEPIYKSVSIRNPAYKPLDRDSVAYTLVADLCQPCMSTLTGTINFRDGEFRTRGQ